MDLTFGEQVKIILSRKGMTIKELAETIEARTGKKMSRQNLTQRLGRDNFQEQDMRMIAGILGCPFYLNILDENISTESNSNDYKVLDKIEAKRTAKQKSLAIEVEEAEEQPEEEETVQEQPEEEPYYAEEDEPEEYYEEPYAEEEYAEDQEAYAEADDSYAVEDLLAEMDAIKQEEEERAQEKENRSESEASGEHEKRSKGWKNYLHFGRKKNVEDADDTVDVEEMEAAGNDEPEEAVAAEAYEGEEDDQDAIYLEDDADVSDDGMVESEEEEEDPEVGDINPYTGKEYETNSVRMHPKRIGYVQVYDRTEHAWADMTEWAFLGYQERKKALLGKDYEPPIYLD